MSRCLRDQALWLVFEGEGSEKDRAHVEGCHSCATRLRRLQKEVETLSQVLREAPPDSTTTATARSFSWRWVPVVATGAAALVFIWTGLYRETPDLPQATTANAPRQEEIVTILENEVYDALFTNDDLPAIEGSSQVSTLAYVQAALDGRWPCEHRHAPRRTVCDQHPFFVKGRGE